MNKTNLLSQRAAAILVATLGCLLIVRWFMPQLAPGLLPTLRLLGVNTPIMLTATGAALFCATLPACASGYPRRAMHLLLLVVATLSSLTLVEHVLSLDLGIDLINIPTAPTAEIPTPGRVAPNTCLAFLAAVLCLTLSTLRHRTRAQDWLMTASAAAVMLIAVTALIGHFLNLSALYQLARYNRMLVPTAFGLSILGVGLWFRLQGLIDSDDESVEAIERRITRHSAAILAFVAISTGIAGFSIIETGMEKSTTQNLQSTAAANGAALSTTLADRLWFSQNMQTRPDVISAFAALHDHPGDQKARAVLANIGDSLLPSGVDHIRFFGAGGALISESGSTRTDAGALRMLLNPSEQVATLVWKNGFFLLSENVMIIDERFVGKVVIEQALPTFDKLITAIQRSNDSTEVLICGRAGADGVCAPSRFYNKPRTIALVKKDGSPAQSFLTTALNQTAVMRFTDLRGIDAVAAYTPLQNFGLAMVLKVDADSLLAPLRGYVLELAAMVAALVLLGVLVARLQILPLLARVVYEQTRNKVILANSNDAFIAMDSQGRVTDWNASAESMFQWSASDAIGQPLASLIVPQEHRAAHIAGVAEFTQTGLGSVINNQREVLALRRDGTLFPVELSVTGFHDGTAFISNAFVRDITARRAADQLLADRERFLLAITDTLPALIAYVDHEQHYQFANAAYASLLQLDPDKMMGKTPLQVLGKKAHAQLTPNIDKVLAGVRVHFEHEVATVGLPSHFLVDYIPDVDAARKVHGFYIMAQDISARKRAELQQTQSEERLRLITDNLPVLISYVDAAHRFQFGNATFKTWLEINPADFIGRPISELIGAEAYEQRRHYFDRALGGETVRFELTTKARGTTRVLQTVYVPHVTADGTIDGVYTLSTDVTPLKEIEKELATQARVDALTGLPNRRQFNERVQDAIARYRRTAQPMALMFIDIDQFKQINDSFGHAGGDEVLRQFAVRLKHSVRETDLVARLAGDEFIIIIDGYKAPDELGMIAEKILAAVRMPMTIDGAPVRVTTSIGVAPFDAADIDVEQVMARADQALYAAKKAGRDRCIEWHAPAPADLVARQVSL